LNTRQNALMKTKNRIRQAQACLLTVALVSLAATLSATPVSPYSLNARVVPRPVTPGDVTKYGLTNSTEVSGGLGTFAVGTPAYLEIEVTTNTAYIATITGINWTLTTPTGSKTAVTNSLTWSTNTWPTNMPVFLPSDQLVYQVAPTNNARMVLRPDMPGQYTVSVTITNTSGTTNVSANFTVGNYAGVFYCELCHSGSEVAPDMYPSWATTAHASIFTEGINGLLGSYSQSCIQCHTVGYDTNASAINDGSFYSVAQSNGWQFPSVLTNSNFAAMPWDLQNVANIQCENCHGPGYEHASSLGNTNFITVPYTVGTCEQCHDAPPTYPQGTQWYASEHAGGFNTEPTIPSGPGRDACVQCHTANGFITAVSNAASTNTTFAPTNTTYAAIGCQTCHEPHGLTIPTSDSHLIRVMASAKFGDGTVITNGGEGNLCMNCHHSRDGDAVTNVLNYKLGLPTWYGGTSSFGPHDGPQGDMIEGINAITYGLAIPSSAHRLTVTNTCVGCHMQTIASTDPGFLLSGGHTFEMSYMNGTNKVDQVGVCNQCHGGITNFNFPVEDYANVGVILGVQTNVQILLDELSTLLPYNTNGATGEVQSSLSPTTNWTTNQLNAAYNWQFVKNDGSLGVHNAPFATGLLNASIASLTGVSVPGGLPYAWVTNYFGSYSNPLADPDADPAKDGVPNWLKYALGLNPLVADKGLAVSSNGVVYANGNALGGNTPTNTLVISTAADITFDTEAGSTYQIQEATALSGGWQDVGSPIVVTATNAGSMSYLTPMAGNLQQFFRVVSSPTPP
jgi:nitrate reductase cytochrome c-type subunit